MSFSTHPQNKSLASDVGGTSPTANHGYPELMAVASVDGSDSSVASNEDYLSSPPRRRSSSRSLFQAYWRSQESSIQEEQGQDVVLPQTPRRGYPPSPTDSSSPLLVRKSSSTPNLASSTPPSCLRPRSSGSFARSVSFSSLVEIAEFDRPMETWAAQGWDEIYR